MQISPRKADKPSLWIIAGPNGSGKSTLYNRTDIDGWGGSIWIINPDLLTLRLTEQEGLTQNHANRAALDRIQAWLDASIEVHQTIGVETVLSTSKYRALVDRAKDRGFDVRMLYVVLDSAELQIERVRLRVSEGGHNVPAEKIISRRARSFQQLALFAKHLDYLAIFDNSRGEPNLVAIKKYKKPLTVLDRLPPDLQQVLESNLLFG
ncbi:MAG TPA: zeta toxin family protein [Sphingobium sp.]